MLSCCPLACIEKLDRERALLLTFCVGWCLRRPLGRGFLWGFYRLFRRWLRVLCNGFRRLSPGARARD